MGTPITPGDPWEEPGCTHCTGSGELFADGSPNQIRVTYTDVENCPLFDNAPDGAFVLPWTGPGFPCHFELWDSIVRYHFVDVAPGGIYCQCDKHELDHGRFYFDGLDLTKTGEVLNGVICNFVNPPLHSGKNGSATIVAGYASDPLFFSYGCGIMPKSNLKYDDYEIEGSDEKVLHFGNLPDSINCRIRYQPANT